ncbi:MAG: FAD/NAD(P)-binding protein [Planctomycetes bacterium]|nr:FAD/NAD(P)-binding protein [Planctomycetota bacterium]
MAVSEARSLNHPRSLYEPEAAEVVAVERLTDLESLYALRLASGQPLGHDPGQFVQVALLGVGECPISVCSSPTRPESFELCVRRVGEVTRHIHELHEGEVVGVRGPLGHGFDVDELHGKDILVVAGGLGIAPVRSLIQYIIDERPRFGDFHLLYGARSPNELLFRNDLTRWRENDDINFHVTVDRPDEQWRGHSGVVTTLFSEVPRLDPAKTMAVVVGPPVMFKFVVLEVLARRIHQKNIFCSLERRMKCGVGKCGHCQVNNVYVCLEGPVFRYGELKALREAIE